MRRSRGRGRDRNCVVEGGEEWQKRRRGLASSLPTLVASRRLSIRRGGRLQVATKWLARKLLGDTGSNFATPQLCHGTTART